MQFYKGDDTEKRFFNSYRPTLENLSLAKDEFLAGAYSCAPLGDMIYLSNRSPLTNAIPQAVFRIAFNEIFQAFGAIGTFEAYLTVFKKIFGNTVGVVFTVPGPGKLNIDITAHDIQLSNFVARYVQDNAYLYDTIITEANDYVMFQTLQGLTSEYEVNQMLFEMVPGGVYTLITLTLG